LVEGNVDRPAANSDGMAAAMAQHRDDAAYDPLIPSIYPRASACISEICVKACFSHTGDPIGPGAKG
jgi:hypothetical protein